MKREVEKRRAYLKSRSRLIKDKIYKKNIELLERLIINNEPIPDSFRSHLIKHPANPKGRATTSSFGPNWRFYQCHVPSQSNGGKTQIILCYAINTKENMVCFVATGNHKEVSG
jgi:mRNA-degrading endonuclease YafQ of YafQ-DinJ toxin-antitoxin module